jgi:hypothetical protein
MRSLFALLVFTALGLTSLRAADIEFVRVWPGWRDAESFERISEYFTGEEKTGREVVLRTKPDERAGFYFLVRVANASEPITGATFVLKVISPSGPEPESTSFPADIPRKSKVFLLGLTGSDWPNSEVHPVAWKLELRSADDTLLASSQSFLWAKPAK